MVNQSISQYLEDRLQQWAEWYSKGNFESGIGYPSQSIEGRWMSIGAILPAQGRRPEPGNPEAEEMELWVRQMFEWNHQIALAVRARYLGLIYTIEKNELKLTKKMRRLATMGELTKAMDFSSVRLLEDRLMKAKNFLVGRIFDSHERLRKVA